MELTNGAKVGCGSHVWCVVAYQQVAVKLTYGKRL